MRQSVKSIIKRLVTFNKIPKFVKKLLGMSTISDFKNGDIVCLAHDKTKRFIVKNNIIIENRIQLLYFKDSDGVMASAYVKPEYLMIAPEQVQFCPFK